MTEDGCALLIASCDAHRDLWPSCLTLYRRYWPDCPYPMHLASDVRAVQDERVRPLCAGPGLTWSEVMRSVLEPLEQEHVLLMLDDYFLAARVDHGVLEAARAELVRLGGAYLRLVPLPRPTRRVPGSHHLGEHEPGVPFRASLQAAFWRRSALLDLLRPGESPWDFERHGSRRSLALGLPFYSSRTHLIRYVGVLVQGQWSPEGIRHCRREGLPIDFTVRPPLSPRIRLERWRRYALLVARGPMSWRLRRALRQLAGR